MEEKERYVKYDPDNDGIITRAIYDTIEKKTIIVTVDRCIDLLNQQSKRIKELCKQVIELNKKNNILRKFEEDILRVQKEPYQFWKENQQLKQQLEESKEENKKLVKALNGDIFINYKVPMENAKLKQQLHGLAKKIVEEIKKELYDCGRTYLEDEPYIEICIVKGILDTILKKFGGEDESKWFI